MTNLCWRCSLALSSFYILILAPGSGLAGDDFVPAPPPPSPEQLHCDALGDGYFAVKGSSACIKISGYVSAGTEFAATGGKNLGPFAPKSGAVIDSQTAVSAEAQFETPLGPGRLYVQVGHNTSGQ